MRVLVVNPGQDTGGMGIRIKRAFDKYGGEWSVRAVRSSENYIQYPADVETYRTPRGVVQRLYDEADVIHCSNSLEPTVRYGKGRWKPSVVTYQGTAFRSRPEPFIAEAIRKRAVQTVSTIDLLTLFENGEGYWSPHPIDIEELQRYVAFADPVPDGKIIIHHSPTNRRVKSTQAFIDATDRLRREDPRVEVLLVEGQTIDKALRLKARAHIAYDQLILGWGTNALEAWGMGIPVIAATEFPRVRSKMIEIAGDDYPPYEATPDTLYDALRTLVNDEGLRREYAMRGLRFVQRFHDEQSAVERLKGFYQMALDMREQAA